MKRKMQTDVYNKEAKKVGTVELPERLFAREWNANLVHQAVRVQTANKRNIIAHAKDRGEVRGGGKKPWRQKGTGRARHGSIRSPIWKGGGATHGPLKERGFVLRMSRKMRQGAIFSAFSEKVKDGEVKIIDSLNIEEPKTKRLFEVLGKFAEDGKGSFLLITPSENKNTYMASRNLKQVKSLDPRSLNTYDILKYKNILMEKDVIPEIEKHYNAVK